MASYRMRIILLYKDGTNQQLTLAVPVEVGNTIAVKGLVATQVYIDKFMQFPVEGNVKFDDFKKGKQ